MKRTMFVLPFTLACVLANAAPRDASDGGSADAGVQRLLRQLTSERDQLQVEKQQLQSELTEKDKELAKLAEKIYGKENTLGKYKGVNEKLVERLNLAQDKLVEMNTAYLEQQGILLDAQKESEYLLELVSKKQIEVEQHVFNNRRMLEINSELLSKYSAKGVLQVFSKREPITQIDRVAVENMIQEYQFELEDISATSHENQISQNYD